jgi:hypothetical protein
VRDSTELGDVGAIWKAMFAFCPWVHWTVRFTPDNEQCAGTESLIGYFLLLGAPDRPMSHMTVGPGSTSPLAVGFWHTGLSGAPAGQFGG